MFPSHVVRKVAHEEGEDMVEGEQIIKLPTL